MAQGHPGCTWGCSDASSPSHPELLGDNGTPPSPSPSGLCFSPPFCWCFLPPRSLAGSGRVAEHQESQRWALISGYCLCRANSTLPARQSRSRPPFLLRQEAAGGDVEPQYESLQLGLFCCLPRLISFNYLSPFFFFSLLLPESSVFFK